MKARAVSHFAENGGILMKAMKKILAAVCCAALTLSAGCSSGPVVKSQTSQVEISFSWWGNDARNKYTIEAIEEFEALHPDIKVNCSYSEWSGYEMRNKVWMISATEADVMQINYGWLNTYSPDGQGYLDINDLSAFVDLNNFTEKDLEYGKIGRFLNAIPIAMNAETVYINKTIYDRYGLDVPKTWDDLFAAAKVMREDDIYPLSAASKSMWLYLITYEEQRTGRKILTADGDLSFNAGDFADMIQFYKKLIDEKVLPQVEYYERRELDNETYAGSVAWVSDAENYFGEAVEKGREIVAADYTTMDGNNVGEGWYAKPATMYAVSKNTAHPREAGMLLDFLLNSEEMAEHQGIEKGIPLSQSARDFMAEEGILEGIQFEASEKMSQYPLSELSPVLEDGGLIDLFFEYSNEFIFDKADAETAANSFYKDAQENYFS